MNSLNLYHAVNISIGTLVGILLGSRASLQHRVLARNSPHLDYPIVETNVDVVCFIVIVLYEVALFFYADGKVLSGVLNIFGLSIVFDGLREFFLQMFAPRRVACRSFKGELILGLVQKNTRREICCKLFALATAIGAFQSNHAVLLAIVSTSLFYTRIYTSVLFPSMSFMLNWFLWLLPAIPLIPLCLVLAARYSTGEDIESTTFPLLDEFSIWVGENSWWSNAIISSFVPGVGIALCLRFDYQRHLDSSATAASASTISGISTLEHTSTVVPARVLFTFPKPYYITALVAWGFPQLCFICAHACANLPVRKVYRTHIITACLACPIMALALMAVARMRGEWNNLWQYTEECDVAPQEANPSISEKEMKAV